MLDRYEKYMLDVESGRAITCKWVKLAVRRQRSDLKRAQKKDFPYFFDEAEAAKVLRAGGLFRHVSGKWAGQLFDPEPYQCFRLAVLFGWKHKETGYRRFRRAFYTVARKNGKSFEASLIANLGLLLDGEARAEIFSAATTRDQARIVFEVAQSMAKRLASDSPAAGAVLDFYAHSVVNKETGGKIAPLSSDAQKLDGHSPHIAIIDEYHEHPTNKVLKVLETGMGARSQPLSVVITTAGFNIEGPCYRLQKTAEQILDGNKVDETFFCIIYTLDEGDDWKDEKAWVKASPNLGVSPSWEFMRAEFQKAINEGHEAEVQFKTKNLNMWVNASSTWIPAEKWDLCGGEIDFGALADRPCWGGLDLAEVFDFTAFCLCWPPDEEGGEYVFKWFFWLPEDSAKVLHGRGVAVYDWARDGWVNLTPGNVVDIEAVIEEIASLGGRFQIQTVGMDPWGTKTNVLKFQEVGMVVSEFRQGFRSMSPPMKDFERLVAQGRVRHGGNPVVRWMLSNVEVSRDPAGNIKPDRSRKENKIDGIVAAIVGLGEAMTGMAGFSGVYSKDLIVFIE